MRNQEELEEEIKTLIYKVTGIKIQNNYQNLLDEDLKIAIVDWLYVIQELELRYHANLAQKIVDDNYSNFTIYNIAKKLL
ncbi:MAG: hypothetical protein KH896_06290 [Clostridiales bacterium]|nr:hypothetical protein [Clostridiales bacterium]